MFSPKLNLDAAVVLEAGAAGAVLACVLNENTGFFTSVADDCEAVLNENAGFFSSAAGGCEGVAEGAPNTEVPGGLEAAVVEDGVPNEKAGAAVAVGVVAEAGAPGVLNANMPCEDAAGWAAAPSVFGAPNNGEGAVGVGVVADFDVGGGPKNVAAKASPAGFGAAGAGAPVVAVAVGGAKLNPDGAGAAAGVDDSEGWVTVIDGTFGAAAAAAAATAASFSFFSFSCLSFSNLSFSKRSFSCLSFSIRSLSNRSLSSLSAFSFSSRALASSSARFKARNLVIASASISCLSHFERLRGRVFVLSDRPP